MNKPAKTLGFKISTSVMFACVVNAAKRTNAVKAAEPIANPLPIAAVVFPTASNLSVLSRTFGSSPVISAIPPALSAIGPYASTASWIPIVASIPSAAIPIPYNPANSYAKSIAKAIVKTGNAVEIIPVPKPEIIFVAEPVSEAFEIS